MNWYRQNRWLGTFLIVFGVALLVSGYFFYRASSKYDDALARFNEAAAERSRLERLDPFPSEANYRKWKVFVEKYGIALNKLKDDLKTRVLPAPPLAPNEFQSRLRQAMITTAEKARANKVQIPDNFALGFDEYTAGLPNTAAATSLGQELSQVELLMNFLLESHVDGITAFTRMRSAEEGGAAPSPTPGTAAARKPSGAAPAGPKMLERRVIDLTFVADPRYARKVLNQIASSNQQFYIMRILHVRNPKDKGPPRELPPTAGAATVQPAQPKTPAAPNSALSFIVGEEHIETSVRIELIRFNF